MFNNFYDIPFYPDSNAVVMDRTIIKDLLEYERYCCDTDILSV